MDEIFLSYAIIHVRGVISGVRRSRGIEKLAQESAKSVGEKPMKDDFERGIGGGAKERDNEEIRPKETRKGVVKDQSVRSVKDGHEMRR